MAWIRNATEQPERRPTDIGWLVVAAVGVAVVGLWAQSQSEIDANFFVPLNSLTNLDGVMKAVYALGSIWAIALVATASGIILFIPKIRGKVPAVTRAVRDIWTVIRNSSVVTSPAN